MRIKALVLACLMLAVGSVNVGASETILPEPITPLDIEDAECSSTDTLAPEHHELPVVGDYETKLQLDVHVLMVQVDPAAAVRIFEWVKDVYAAINIEVRPVYESVDLEIPNTPDTSPTGAVLSTSQSQAYIDASKAHFGGTRPAHADVVYTMLGPEIAGSVAGQADCVGGIAYPDAAFAVGETRWEDAHADRWSGKIVAHEIAHLLGAHHHYANCAQGQPDDIVAYIQPCTLMFNDVLFISPVLSTLEAAVVRRWALDYLVDAPAPDPSPSASPSPSVSPEPEPDPEVAVDRSIEVAASGDQMSGAVTAPEGWDGCASEVPVNLQRRKDGRWRNVAASETSDDGAFRFKALRAGTYRVRAPRVEMGLGDTCKPATSRRVRIR